MRHAIFGQFLLPLPCHTLSHIPGTPRKYVTHLGPPIFSRPSTKNPDKSPLLFAGIFVRGVCHGVFSLEGFVPCGFCPFPLLSEYICCNRTVNITLNFMFHMYDKKCISVTSPASDPPSRTPGPLPSSVTYFMDGPY